MSDFESRCSSCEEIFEGRKGPCPKCGNKNTHIHTMDGKTGAEWKRIEAAERYSTPDDDEVEDINESEEEDEN